LLHAVVRGELEDVRVRMEYLVKKYETALHDEDTQKAVRAKKRA
jgi:hypothetical protein